MDINQWFETITGGSSQRAAARKIGLQQSKLSRQLSGGHLAPEIIRDLARAFKRPVVDELIATGFLAPSDTEIIGVEQALALATNSQILREISQRVDPEARRMFRGEGAKGVVDLAEDTNKS